MLNIKKHKFLRWNETSRRYVDDSPEMFVPDKWRKAADNVKQGSSDESLDMTKVPSWWVNDFEIFSPEVIMDVLVNYYNHLIEQGVAPEQARMILPQAMMTEWVWSGSLDAFASMCKLRLDPHTQYESRLVAQEISKHMEKLFPHSWKALLENG